MAGSTKPNARVSEKFNRAKIQMIREIPFFGALVMRCVLLEDDTISPPTMCTNGKYIKYHPQFVLDLPVPDLVFVLAHEVFHCASFHHTRRGARDPLKWNHAADYVVNNALIKVMSPSEALTEKYGMLVDPKYEGMLAEQVYELLPDDEKGDGLGTGFGGVEDAESDGSSASRSHEEQRWREAIEHATAVACGKGSEAYNQLLGAQASLIDWRQILCEYLTEVTKDDYSLRKPKRYGKCMVATLNDGRTGSALCIIDESGSMSNDQVSQAFAEVQAVIESFGLHVWVAECDTAVANVRELSPGEKVELQRHAGGGTDMRPAFEWAEENNLEPSVCIVLTDGCFGRGEYPEREPDYPVLWVIIDGMNFEPEYGVVIDAKGVKYGQ